MNKYIVTLLSIFLAPWHMVHAGDVYIVVENDSIAGTDRNYTNGLLLGYVGDPGRAPGAALWIAETILKAGNSDKIQAGIALGHSIYTPDNKRTTLPVPDEHPYAGWLYIEPAVIATRPNAVDILRLNLGIVGPAALGRQVQNNFHSIFGIDGTNGWANQLRNEPGLVVHYDRQWRGPRLRHENGLFLALSPHGGASVGNVLIEARGGVTFRVGQGLDALSGPPRIEPGLGLPPSGERDEGFRWQFFAGIEGRAVAHNLFLDGSSFRDSLSVERRIITGDAQAGLIFGMGPLSGAFTYVVRFKEFTTQSGIDRFGSFTLSMSF